ncbi:unnamed protein product [Ceutorhynchus assimilis]|uniref:Uncharacterized protein n=1 Tax=Ceutorhynchus assimilis TaxID=467358 RepID=A0A9N9QDT4_9CUCU|nr:unnamed protein product [Ceutorhynchus assimilis]
MGSSCTTIRQQEAERLALEIDATKKTALHGYGNGRTPTIGTTSFRIKVDDVETTVSAHIVANVAQEIPILLGRNYTELPGVLVIKDDIALTFFSRSLVEINAIETEPNDSKIVLRIAENTTILPNHWGHVQVDSDSYEGDLCIDASVRMQEGQEYCISYVIISIKKGEPALLPYISLADNDIDFRKNRVIVRACKCTEEENSTEMVMRVDVSSRATAWQAPHLFVHNSIYPFVLYVNQ